MRWVMAYEGDAASRRVTAAARVAVGHEITVGREAELPLGTEVADPRVSRHALTVHATELGWRITVTNRNGGVLHPWAQPFELAGPEVVVDWPLVAVRVPAEPGAHRHWVLLEADDLPIVPGGPSVTETESLTDRVERPAGLPPSEREALSVMFAAHLQWPPRDTAEPLLLKQAAKRLGIAVSSLQDRLTSARARAARLGLGPTTGLADPAYLHLLVRAGYLAPPASFPHRPVPVRNREAPGARPLLA